MNIVVKFKHLTQDAWRELKANRYIDTGIVPPATAIIRDVPFDGERYFRALAISTVGGEAVWPAGSFVSRVCDNRHNG